MDNNNLYQELIQTKTVMIQIIRTLRPSTDIQKVIKQQHASYITVIKLSGIFLCQGRLIWVKISSLSINQDRKIFLFLKKRGGVKIRTQNIMRDVLLSVSLLPQR